MASARNPQEAAQALVAHGAVRRRRRTAVFAELKRRDPVHLFERLRRRIGRLAPDETAQRRESTLHGGGIAGLGPAIPWDEGYGECETWLVLFDHRKKGPAADRKNGRRAGADPLVELCFLTPLAEGREYPLVRRQRTVPVNRKDAREHSPTLRRYSSSPSADPASAGESAGLRPARILAGPTEYMGFPSAR